MYDYKFQRIEEKYLLDKDTKEKLLSRISDYIEKDKFFNSNIHNIYFDNDNNDLIINSLDKPVFKDKFRVRSYGDMSLDGEVFLETKVKYKGVVSKRRIKTSIREFNKYMKKKKCILDDQVFREINYYFKFYNLKPAIYIAYDRESYKGKDDNDLRITFDTNLRSRRNDLYFKENVEMKKYFEDEYYIMEIKAMMAMPLWLVRILSEMEIKPVSFSKYGKIYEEEMKERVDCYA